MTKEAILDAVRQYAAETVQPKSFQPGDRINYAGRVYDADELTCLVDASLDFWLTAGKYTKEFEEGLAQYLGVRFASLTNSGSSAKTKRRSSASSGSRSSRNPTTCATRLPRA